MARVFIIGGTREARLVAGALCAAGHGVMSSLAGVTAVPRLPAGSVRVGGYGGDAPMAEFVRRWGADVLVDCAHPFAVRIKARLAWVAEELKVPLWVYRRAPWQAGDGDDWHFVDGLAQGMALACALSGSKKGGRIFAALGRQQFAALACLRCEFLLVRQVPGMGGADMSGFMSPMGRTDGRNFVSAVGAPNVRDFVSPVEVVSGYPPDSEDEEIALLRRYDIQVVLCKESGGSSGIAKLAAARSLSLPTVILRQPAVNYPSGTRFFKDAEELQQIAI